MRKYVRDFREERPLREVIGLASENAASQLVVKVQGILEDSPQATFSILVRRADGVVYPADTMLAPDDQGNIAYVLLETDVAVPGLLEIEVQARDGGRLIKSRTFPFVVAMAMCGDGVPDPIEVPWADRIINDTADNATRAESAAKEAKAAASFLTNVELSVDVENGTLNLYAEGDYSPIDITMNGLDLEVWQN